MRIIYNWIMTNKYLNINHIYKKVRPKNLWKIVRWSLFIILKEVWRRSRRAAILDNPRESINLIQNKFLMVLILWRSLIYQSIWLKIKILQSPKDLEIHRILNLFRNWNQWGLISERNFKKLVLKMDWGKAKIKI
jgi:hypothetical protein